MLRSPRPSSSRAHPPHALHHTHNYAYHLQRTPGTTHENAVILTSPALRVELRPEMNPCRPFHNRWVPHPRRVFVFWRAGYLEPQLSFCSSGAHRSGVEGPAFPSLSTSNRVLQRHSWPTGSFTVNSSSACPLSRATLRRLTCSKRAQIRPTGPRPRKVTASSVAAQAVAGSAATPKKPDMAAATTPICVNQPSTGS